MVYAFSRIPHPILLHSNRGCRNYPGVRPVTGDAHLEFTHTEGQFRLSGNEPAGNWAGWRVTPCLPNGTKIASFPSNILLTNPSLIHAHWLQGHNYKQWQRCRKPWSNDRVWFSFTVRAIVRPLPCVQGSGAEALCCCTQSDTIPNSRRGVIWLITCFKFHSGTLIMC